MWLLAERKLMDLALESWWWSCRSWSRECWSWTGLVLEVEWGKLEEELEELVGVGRGGGGLGARRVRVVKLGVRGAAF